MRRQTKSKITLVQCSVSADYLCREGPYCGGNAHGFVVPDCHLSVTCAAENSSAAHMEKSSRSERLSCTFAVTSVRHSSSSEKGIPPRPLVVPPRQRNLPRRCPASPGDRTSRAPRG
eukprot:1177451-Prorocentrum_minimum.AAC.7